MKDINIGKILMEKRREKGITQDELAAYMGVSKASVSKWETGQSYPDISFLPQLAAYFNISIDALMGYSPQMNKEDIQKLYHELAARFASEPFGVVYETCTGIIKKYYACFPLLLQMAVLYANHHMLSPDEETGKKMLSEAVELCKRVRSESGDLWTAKEGVMIEGVCYLMMQRPSDVLSLVGEDVHPMSQETEMIAQAYQLLGNNKRAEEVYQICIYQHLLSLLELSVPFMTLNLGKPEKMDEILKRTLKTAEIYQVENLNPNTLIVIYLGAAQLYCSLGKTEDALEMLRNYANIATHKFFPINLHGDAYLDKIEWWMETLELGSKTPRSEKVIKKSLIDAVSDSPVFVPLKNKPEFKQILFEMETELGGI